MCLCKYILIYSNCQVFLYLLKYISVGVDGMIKVQLRLDKTLNNLGISRYELSKLTGVRYQIIDNYYKNKVVRYDGYVLSRICNALKCEISDILEIVED